MSLDLEIILLPVREVASDDALQAIISVIINSKSSAKAVLITNETEFIFVDKLVPKSFTTAKPQRFLPPNFGKSIV